MKKAINNQYGYLKYFITEEVFNIEEYQDPIRHIICTLLCVILEPSGTSTKRSILSTTFAAHVIPNRFGKAYVEYSPRFRWP
jgi:hypothetical protein